MKDNLINKGKDDNNLQYVDLFSDNQDQTPVTTQQDSSKQHFKFETMGGDASLLHLASQIDRGIKKRLQEKETEESKKWRAFYKILRPLKGFILFSYVLMTMFERPSWCLKLIACSKKATTCESVDQKNLVDFDEWQCNNKAQIFTNSNLPKLPQTFTISYEVFCLCSLLLFQTI